MLTQNKTPYFDAYEKLKNIPRKYRPGAIWRVPILDVYDSIEDYNYDSMWMRLNQGMIVKISEEDYNYDSTKLSDCDFTLIILGNLPTTSDYTVGRLCYEDGAQLTTYYEYIGHSVPPLKLTQPTSV